MKGIIGSGVFGKVYEAVRESDGELVVIKHMKDFAKDNYHTLKAYREVYIHSKLSKKKCIYVPKLYQVIMTPTNQEKTK